MPLPKPKSGETQSTWMDRCMSSGTMKSEFPKTNVRWGVCKRLWRSDKNALEGKDVGVDVTRDEQDTLDRTPRRLLDSRRKRTMRRRIDMLRVAYTGTLRQLTKRVIAGASVDEVAGEAQDAMTRSFAAAYESGITLAGLPEWTITDRQVAALMELVQAEMEFFRAFMRGLEAVDDRIDLYGGAVDDAMWRGWSSVMPREAIIEWRLSVAEHCPDCLTLAANSPYSKPGEGANPLPTVPRNGDTRCLGNCKCYLETVYPFESTIAPKVGVEVTKIGDRELDPMSADAIAAAQSYQELVERLAYHRRMAILEGGEHAAIARRLRGEIDALAARFQHDLRLTTTMAEITAPVTTAVALGRRFVGPRDIDDTLLLAVATVIAMDWADRGEISAVSTEPPMVTLEDDPARTYRVDAVGKHILFVDR